MIRWIRGSHPKYKDLTLKDGLNVILADKAADSTDKQSRNGAGKSSVLEVVHFLLGGSADKESLFKNTALIDATFSMEFDLAKRFTTVERMGAQPTKIRVSAPTFEDWPITPAIDKVTHEPTLSNTNWRSVLGHFMFGLPVGDQADEASKGPSFRMLFSYFARRKRSGGFMDPERTAAKQQIGDQQIALSYLLGLDWTIAQKFEEIRVREKSLKELRRIIGEGALATIVGTSAELRTELTLAEDTSRKLQESLAGFKVVPQYQALEKEASELTTRISYLSDANTTDRILLTELNKTIESERPPDLNDVTRLYEEAGIIFPELVHRRFDDVKAFHDSVIRNRKSYLASEVTGAESRIKAREADMTSMERRRTEVMGMLKSGGALEHYSTLQAELARKEGAVQVLRERHKAAQQLESEKTKLEIERNQLLIRLRQDYEEQADVLNAAIIAFEEVSEALYEKAGRLQIEPTTNGPKFSVMIDSKRSSGISNMQIFCFDMMLMRVCATRGIGPGFLFHDSHIFDGVDNRQIAKALQVGAAIATQHGFQYVVTMNSDTAPENEIAGLDISEFVLPQRLLDDGADGGLFGVHFN